MAGQTNDTYVMSQIFTTELSAKANLVSFCQYFFLQFDITECTTIFVSCCRQVIIEMSRSQLHCQQILFGRSTADNESDMVRRASSSSQCFHLFNQERNQCTRIQNCLCFLIQICFVGRTTSFCYTKKFILHTFSSLNVNLCRKVTFCIYLIIHIQRCILRVTQIFFSICFVNTQRKSLFVRIPCPYLLSFFTVNNSSTGILAEWKYTFRCHFCITQESQCHVLVILAGFRIVQDFCYLFVVRTTKHK